MVEQPHGLAIVVGAGVGGLTAAIALRQAGYDVRLFERAAGSRQLGVGGGIHLWHNAMRGYQRLGLADPVAAAGATVERAEFRGWRGQLLAAWPVGQIGRDLGAPTVGISRADLARTLVGIYGEDQIEFAAACVGFEQDTSGVTVRFADGRTERGDVLVGADGLNSVVRAQLLGQAPPRYAGYTIWQGITDLRPAAAPPGLFRVLWGRGQRFAHYEVGGDRLYWFALANAPAGGQDGDGVRASLVERFRAWPEPVAALIGATDEAGISRLDIRDRKPVRHWSHGRVTLLGDAAHPMTFNVGQGACQAVEDAVVLARCLREHDSVVGALQAYDNRRIRRTATIATLAWRLGAVGRWEHPLACALRDRLMRATMSGFVLKQHQQDMVYEF